MSEKILKNLIILRLIKRIDASKQAIDLNLVDINKIVISDKIKHMNKGF